MEARSYIENIANRTTMRGVISTMTRLLLVVVVVGAVAMMLVTNFHPVALITGVVLLGFGVVLARDVVIVTKQRRSEPLDLAFEPAPNRGLVTPGTVFGAAAGLVLFGGIMGGTMFVGNRDGSFIGPIALVAVGVALAIIGIPTLGVAQRKWTVLQDALRQHPEMIPYLQDARDRFPASAPFPFSAPTDQVTIP
ncbi:MAG: hypothetical protein Q4F65_05105 [Propionibacteriaceae bacterium]|nr:hypothetical protein [Propionibacteriaceae bacterium]